MAARSIDAQRIGGGEADEDIGPYRGRNFVGAGVPTGLSPVDRSVPINHV